MDDRDSAQRINDEAAQWAVRLDGAEPDAAARAELDAWLAGDERRAGALLRAEAGWTALDRARAAAPGRAAPAPAPARPARAWIWGGAVAAGLALVALTTTVLTRPRPVEYATQLGEVRRVPLADGSMAAINTESRIDVAFRPDRREVRLDRGEAWFKVAKNPERPFVVAAGDIRVRAVGTAFSVRRRPGGADVLVTEGVVEAWTEGSGRPPVRISAGARTFVTETAEARSPVSAPEEIDRALAWRDGEIAFDGDDTLAEAAVEFNRYNARKLYIDDPRLAARTLIGRFRTDEPDTFARAVAATMDAQVRLSANEIRLTRTNPVGGPAAAHP